MYADDLILLSLSSKGLQNSLDALHAYSQQWELKVNIKKTKVLTFNKQGLFAEKKDFHIGDQILEMTREYDYLGLKITAGGQFTEAKSKLKDKGLKAYFKLCKTFGASKPNPSIFLHTFNHTVKQVLLYGAEIWGTFDPSNGKFSQDKTKFPLDKAYEHLPQEQILLRFGKFMLGMPRTSCSDAIRGELGLFPIYINVLDRMIDYWSRLEQLEDDSLVAEAYKADQEQTQSWSKCIHFVLEQLGLGRMWHQKKKITASKKAIYKIKKSIRAQFENKWLDSMKNDVRKRPGEHNKLRIYRQFKLNFELENYLVCIPNEIHRKMLCKFRISAHKLNIEMGRHPHIDVYKRVCNMCKIEAVEDEGHFLMDCTVYSEMRKVFFTKITSNFNTFNKLNNHEKFIWLLACREPSICRELAKYLTEAFKLRDCILKRE
jgi:hypothetical protein